MYGIIVTTVSGDELLAERETPSEAWECMKAFANSIEYGAQWIGDVDCGKLFNIKHVIKLSIKKGSN